VFVGLTYQKIQFSRLSDLVPKINNTFVPQLSVSLKKGYICLSSLFLPKIAFNKNSHLISPSLCILLLCISFSVSCLYFQTFVLQAIKNTTLSAAVSVRALSASKLYHFALLFFIPSIPKP